MIQVLRSGLLHKKQMQKNHDVKFLINRILRGEIENEKFN
jgi:hypothetical protein